VFFPKYKNVFTYVKKGGPRIGKTQKIKKIEQKRLYIHILFELRNVVEDVTVIRCMLTDNWLGGVTNRLSWPRSDENWSPPATMYFLACTEYRKWKVHFFQEIFDHHIYNTTNIFDLHMYLVKYFFRVD